MFQRIKAPVFLMFQRIKAAVFLMFQRIKSAAWLMFQRSSGPLQSDGCKESALLSFHINSKPIWYIGNFMSREASVDHTAV